jgi:REP element-mobilizing transposase RayT
MSDEYYFANKYRIESNRMRGFDYRSWWFFITICTDNHEHYFGEIINEKMILNDMGNVAHQCRIDIPKHFPNVVIDEFVVMPNHVHWILVMDGVYDKLLVPNNITSDNIFYSKISPKKWELWTVIRSYKSACTYIINKLDSWPFHRQSNYYDNIIRNEEGLEAIRVYIKNNPKIWSRGRNKKILLNI